MSVVRREGRIVCAGCGHALAEAGRPWKQTAARSEVTFASIPGAGGSVHPDLVLRRFACPACGHLLDTETALPDDPVLDDVVEG